VPAATTKAPGLRYSDHISAPLREAPEPLLFHQILIEHRFSSLRFSLPLCSRGTASQRAGASLN
jgi:hypothetical protein